MKNPNLTPQRDPHRRVTTIYLIDGSRIIVEVIEWGGGSTPVVVRTENDQIWRQGIEATWSCYPDQATADRFRKMRQMALKQSLPFPNSNAIDERSAA